MRLGLALIDTAFSAHPTIDLDLVAHAEELGFESVWAAEAYGCDAVTSATWLAAHTKRMKVGTAIMQIPAAASTRLKSRRDKSLDFSRSITSSCGISLVFICCLLGRNS